MMKLAYLGLKRRDLLLQLVVLLAYLKQLRLKLVSIGLSGVKNLLKLPSSLVICGCQLYLPVKLLPRHCFILQFFSQSLEFVLLLTISGFKLI